MPCESAAAGLARCGKKVIRVTCCQTWMRTEAEELASIAPLRLTSASRRLSPCGPPPASPLWGIATRNLETPGFSLSEVRGVEGRGRVDSDGLGADAGWGGKQGAAASSFPKADADIAGIDAAAAIGAAEKDSS